ncbi:uncharacterized protein L969DRAFT_88728 [Mixia osmundae IAM 14324]|uniref:Uncharacterized protein n=1 Tax=Mixia osmundae (strain CBS 9802 / IAM 14324 / JCM 22182 / KY 12970) TaxID=764103 RepID=G7DZ76_MIXOS|nr:uncharacterized protein L969DRAFT_88728 [Mixia osmundae IAM 14324]KEI38288.1 hypothetical protein L969DRAFT_88728 [Mixia osmundae IAM 14324]GAA95886.1 hypothetical protein E5Q_02544 [Mixia osmundae IAM 14324]
MSRLARASRPVSRGCAACEFSTSAFVRAVPPSTSASADGSSSSTTARSEQVGGSSSAVGTGRKKNNAQPALTNYAKWLRTDGIQFKRPRTDGQPNWIGSSPFPGNPSFRPATPLSELTKNRIFVSFQNKLRQNLQRDRPLSELAIVRELANRHQIAMDRVKAVIRLKALSLEFKQNGLPLQTTFRDGMELALGVRANQSTAITEPVEGNVERRAGRHQVFEMYDEEAGDGAILLKIQEEKAKRRANADALRASGILEGKPLAVVEPVRPGRPRLSVLDITGTPKGRTLEQTYRNLPKANKQRIVQ